jgi:hypothetical protein
MISGSGRHVISISMKINPINLLAFVPAVFFMLQWDAAIQVAKNGLPL